MTSDDLRALHRALCLPRAIEGRMLLLLRQGRLSKWFAGVGQEAVSVGVMQALRPDDWVLPLHRNLGVFTARVDLDRLYRQLLGRAGGFTAGRDRSFHFGDPARHVVGMISHLGAMLPVACGLALADQLAGRDRVAVGFVGDGGTSEGDVHEAMNLAAVWRLPVVFIVENNQWGLSTPAHEQYACARLADRAAGYGMPGAQIDGNDVRAVTAAMGEAVARARAGEGPTLIECLTYRMRGHEEASGVAYVPPDELAAWAERDPLARFEAELFEAGVMTQAEAEAVRAELDAAVRDAVDAALQAPLPDSDAATELAAVYAPAVEAPPERAVEGPERRYVDAVAEGLAQAMAEDDRVLLLGQDVAEYGGVFKVSAGLVERFGKGRVRNTPIIESGALGAAMGLALNGLRPVVEMQFADFVTCGFNQIVNNLAKTHYRWGAALPVVVRMPQGAGTGAGPYHSQSVEAWFTHVAGLKVVAPATPFDAKGLLLASLDDPNPVLFLEHKALYRAARGPVPEGAYRVPLGVARVARAGDAATVVTWGSGVGQALDAAARLGLDLEVIDLRTLLPWDVEAVAASVRRTGRALVLHEAPLTGGFGGEIAATLGKVCFEWLDAPVERVGALDTPVPFAKALEAIHLPTARLDAALRALVAY